MTYQRPIPTHFLALRLSTSPSPAFQDFRDHVIQNHTEYAKHLIPLPKIHMTLLIMQMNNQNSESMLSTFQSCQKIVNECCPNGITLSLNKMGTFGNGRVVWVAPTAGREVATVTQLANILKDTFQSQNLMDGSYKFKPHVTLMKIKMEDGKKSKRSEDAKKVPIGAYFPFAAAHFGTHQVEFVDFLAMKSSTEGEDDEERGYDCLASLQVPPASTVSEVASDGFEREDGDQAQQEQEGTGTSEWDGTYPQTQEPIVGRAEWDGIYDAAVEQGEYHDDGEIGGMVGTLEIPDDMGRTEDETMDSVLTIISRIRERLTMG